MSVSNHTAAVPLVLVADDDQGIRTLIAKVLHELGVGVLLAGDGVTAVHLTLVHRAKLCCAILRSAHAHD
jgi:CheY-like chemotaxis protein